MSDVYDLVIIGGGAAGLSAGLYAARARMKTVLVERVFMGGQIVNTGTIENYPGFPKGIAGPELAAAFEEQASNAGLEYTFGEVTGIDVTRRPMAVRTESEELLARSIIITAGGDHLKLGVPGEAELEARGVSYCATCDGNFFAGQEVAVIGGGDTAMDEGLYLAQICSKVTVIHRRDQLRAAKVLQERAFANPRIQFIWDTTVERIEGDGKVAGLALKNVKTGERRQMPVAGVFVAIGFVPNSRPFQGVVDLDAGGHIKVDLLMRTSVPGVFAAGDVRWQSMRQLASAAGDGVTAALAAYEYLQSAR